MKALIKISMMALVLATSPLQAGEGKALYEENCTRTVAVTWVDEDIQRVADYLNKHFYKF